MDASSSYRQVLGSLTVAGGLVLGLMTEFGPSVGASEVTTELPKEEEIGCPVEHNVTERFKVAHFDFEYVSKPLLVSLWVLFASCAKVFFHSQKKLAKLFPESCLLIVIGVILGIILYFVDAHENHQLNTHTFFLLILPPIIIDAGYFMPSRPFFDQFGTILLYAVIGTLINTLMIGFSLWGVGLTGVYGPDVCLPLLHALVFASLLAAVDPVAVLAVFESIHVNSVLYIIVFGEALLNDGISVVLYHLFEGFTLIGQDKIEAIDIVAGIGSFVVIVIGAPGIGIVLGFIGGFLSRFTHHVRIMEPLIVIVICYMSFLVCEMFHLSGILGCTFCGITMRKYVEANISEKSQTTIKYAMKMMASAAEAIIFMYLGIAAVSNERVWNTPFILLTLLFCLVYRVIGVILQTFLANRIRLVKVSWTDQCIMSFGGLRGAIAFALSALLEKEVYKSRELMITATIVVVYFTNLILGTLVEPMVKLLKIKREEHALPTMNEKIANRVLDHLMLAVEVVAMETGHNTMRERFSQFNNKFLKPCLVGHKPHRKQHVRGRGSEIFRVYRQLNAKDARKLSRNPSTASSMHRWSTIVPSNKDLFGNRNMSMYELPDYWKGSSSNMSDTESKNAHWPDSGVYTIPMTPSYNGMKGSKPCTCNCHSTTHGVTTPTYHKNGSAPRALTYDQSDERESTVEPQGNMDHTVGVTFNVNRSSANPTMSSNGGQPTDGGGRINGGYVAGTYEMVGDLPRQNQSHVDDTYATVGDDSSEGYRF